MKFAVIGSDTSKSLSPALNNWIYDQINPTHSYSYFEIYEDSIDTVLDNLRKNKLEGINITNPYKISIIPCLNSTDIYATRIGAVNCVRSINGNLRGYNTDYYGFKKLVEIHNVNFSDSKIIVLGAGGASRAICSFLSDNNIQFSIYNRTTSKVNQVIKDLKISKEIVNVNGGGIALGHPIGASGARLLVTLIHEMIKQNKSKGCATLCVGGGMGISMCIERN